MSPESGAFDSGEDLPGTLGYPLVWRYCSDVCGAREIPIALEVFITPSEKSAPGERGPVCGSPKDRLVFGRDGPLVRVPLHVVCVSFFGLDFIHCFMTWWVFVGVSCSVSCFLQVI